MVKATLILDIHDTSIFLSGAMLLQAEIERFLNIPEEDRKEDNPDIPSQEELEASLSLCKEKIVMLEALLIDLERENNKG